MRITRRQVAGSLVTAGALAAAVGTLGLVFGWGSRPGSTPALAPAATATASPAAPGQSSGTPAVLAFIDQFVAAIRAGDTTFLFTHLHPAVIKLYGADQCRTSVATMGDPSAALVVKSISGPQQWVWQASGHSALVSDVYTLSVKRTARGSSIDTDIHFGLADGQLTFFHVCGTPLPG